MNNKVRTIGSLILSLLLLFSTGCEQGVKPEAKWQVTEAEYLRDEEVLSESTAQLLNSSFVLSNNHLVFYEDEKPYMVLLLNPKGDHDYLPSNFDFTAKFLFAQDGEEELLCSGSFATTADDTGSLSLQDITLKPLSIGGVSREEGVEAMPNIFLDEGMQRISAFNYMLGKNQCELKFEKLSEVENELTDEKLSEILKTIDSQEENIPFTRLLGFMDSSDAESGNKPTE